MQLNLVKDLFHLLFNHQETFLTTQNSNKLENEHSPFLSLKLTIIYKTSRKILWYPYRQFIIG